MGIFRVMWRLRTFAIFARIGWRISVIAKIRCMVIVRGKRKENTQVADIPIIISSGYRSEEVNMKCGGAKNSNHLTGCAVDIRCYGPEQMIRMAGILLDIADGTKRDFDELILEKRGTTYWIHFAVRPKDNRRKILFDCRWSNTWGRIFQTKKNRPQLFECNFY